MAGIKIKFDALTDDAFRKVDGLYRKISQGPGKTPTGQQQIQALMTEMVRSKQATFASFGGQEFPIEKQVQKFGANLKQARQGMAELAVANKAMLRGMASELKAFDWNTLHSPRRAGAVMQSDKFLAQAAQQARAMGALQAGNGFSWKQFGMGAAVAPFSPWLGARGISNAFGGGGSGGGGGGSGISGAIFGAGGMGKFQAAFIAIHAVIMTVKYAFEQLHKAIQDTAKLYQESARTATAPGQLFQMQSAFKAVGMTVSDAETLRLRGEHPTGGRSGATMPFPGTDILLGAGRGTRQIGELQQIKNMSDYIERAWRESALDAQAMASAARPLQNTMFEMTSLAREWNTLWSQFATVLSIAIVPMLQSLENQMRMLNAYVLFWVKAWQMIGVLPKNMAPGQSVIQTGGGAAHTSAWEKMGFVIGGFSGQNYAKTTAENTSKIANTLNAIFEYKWSRQPPPAGAGLPLFLP